MKKIISILIAVLMLCTLSISAFAADELPSVKYTPQNVFTASLTEAGEYKEIMLNAHTSDSGSSMTIDCNGTITAGELSVSNTELVIKSGSELHIKNRVDIDWQGTITIEEGAKLVLMAKENGTYNGDNYKRCKFNGCKIIVKGEFSGETSFVEVGKSYGIQAELVVEDKGVVKMFFPDSSRDRDAFADFMRKTEGTIVTLQGNTVIGEAAHHLDNEYCIYCGYTAPTHVHNYKNNMTCSCGKTCPHDHWEGGVCQDCGYVCPHNSGECGLCGAEITGGTTVENENLGLGSALSDGNMSIIIGIAALVIGLGGGFFLGKIKKKPATANGAPAQNNDDEE